jgi:alkanesulfonate monooxygenase SsuD/methylene tetrahydromethanopterin reductase-like flavin-dependent oxidoreductase (luciferase family)
MQGDRAGAIATVPDAFADEISLIGSVEKIRDRLQAWEETPVTHLLVSGASAEGLKQTADLVLGA